MAKSLLTPLHPPPNKSPSTAALHSPVMRSLPTCTMITWIIRLRSSLTPRKDANMTTMAKAALWELMLLQSVKSTAIAPRDTYALVAQQSQPFAPRKKAALRALCNRLPAAKMTPSANVRPAAHRLFLLIFLIILFLQSQIFSMFWTALRHRHHHCHPVLHHILRTFSMLYRGNIG